MEKVVCLECNKNLGDASQIGRHVRSHCMTLQQYKLKHVYTGLVPKCKCGCNKETSWNVALKDYAEFVHGHHAFGRKKSDDEKRRIGEKNSTNMKQFMNNHPELCTLKNKQMRSGITQESEQRRLASTRQAYANMTNEDKVGFKERTKSRWDAGEMNEHREKAAKTFKQRSSDGLYDFKERNQKLSNTITKKYLEGGFEWSRGKYVSTKTNKECYYRSSWELILMKQLDEDPDVLDWESEFTAIPYVFEGINHQYIPDFHVVRQSSGHSIIEVKPQTLRIIPKNVAKREIAKQYCVDRGWKYEEWEPS